jgi:DNA-binding NtrC family response regulator
MPLNILCVDDSRSWRIIFQMHFQDYLTPNVDLAENYESALQKIRQKRYDLIVLDGLEGDCFRIHQDIKEIPHGDIIIFSGNDQLRAEARKRGIPFYSKSEATESLDEIVSQYKASVEK